MTHETLMAIVGAFLAFSVAFLALVVFQLRAQSRDIREREARDERRHRQTEVELAIARRWHERERASRTKSPDTPGGCT